jgi:tetratricopeptide (TPR) repeat protein
MFIAAVNKPNGAERASYLDSACGKDADLRERIEALLREHDQLGSFLESPAAASVATVDDPVSEAAGMRLGPYKLLQEIGEGGMGTVWMAEQQEPVRRLVALKVIKAGMDSVQIIARFEAERQALALMDHPNIAKVLDAGTTSEVRGQKSEVGGQGSLTSDLRPLTSRGRPYFVMELVKGTPITKYCDEHRLTPRERLELFVLVCQAIQHAHQKGIIHRDVKPSNVLVAPYDGKPVVKVIDFGVAKATGQRLTERTLFTGFGAVVGTLEYMSPEQAELNNQDIDTRSDIYSLGVLLYELLTGTTPLERKRAHEAGLLEALQIIREDETPPPSVRLSTLTELPSIAANRGLEPKMLSGLVRGELDWIVMKAVEKGRSRRYQTANAFACDIQRYLADEPLEACRPAIGYRLSKFARRHKTGVGIAAMAAVAVLLAVGGFSWVLYDRAAWQAKVAEEVRSSLQRARTFIAEKQLVKARQELAEAKGRLGNEHLQVGNLAHDVEAVGEEVKAVEADWARFQRFLALIDRGNEAETSPKVELALTASAGRMKAQIVQTKRYDRDPAKAVPFLLQALSCYGVMDRDHWSAGLEQGFLEPDKVAEVRRMVYEELLWLADDLTQRRVDHGSGRTMSPKDAAQQGLVYMAKAQALGPPTRAFYWIRASCRRLLGKEAEARTDEERAREMRATIALDHYLLGQAAYHARDHTTAVKQFEAALQLEPTHYWSLMRLGHCLLHAQEKDVAAAVMAYTGCIMQRPKHAHAYFCRGFAYDKLRRTEEALADYAKAIELDPECAPAQYNRGVALAFTGDVEGAVACFRQAIAADPKHANAHYNLGVAQSRKGDVKGAIACYRQAIAANPKHALAHTNLGVALAATGDAEGAIASYQQAIAADPNHAPAHTNLGLALEGKGEVQEAVACFRQAIAADSKLAAAHLNLGNALYRMKDVEGAIACYHQAIAADPKLATAHTSLGDALAGKGEVEGAIACYRQAIAADPNYAPAHNNLGLALKGKADVEGAVAYYRQAIAADPKHAPAHTNLGNVLKAKGDVEGAVACYRRAIAADPKHAPSHFNLGVALHGKGDVEGAIDCFRAAISADAKYAHAHGALAAALLRQGRLAQAGDAARRCLQLVSADHPLRRPVAQLLQRSERLLALDSRLSAVLKGEAEPRDTAERLALAGLARQPYKRQYTAAARLYAAAFGAKEATADLLARHRYHAACAAALAGCGQGWDAVLIDDKQGARLRRQALDWLRGDLTAWKQLLEKEPEQARAAVQKALRQWQQDTDFAGVRGDALAKLPESEGVAWRQLWDDVSSLLARMQPKAKEAPPEKP